MICTKSSRNWIEKQGFYKKCFSLKPDLTLRDTLILFADLISLSIVGISFMDSSRLEQEMWIFAQGASKKSFLAKMETPIKRCVLSFNSTSIWY